MTIFQRSLKHFRESGIGSYLNYLTESKPAMPHGRTILLIFYGLDLWMSVAIGTLMFWLIQEDVSLILKIRFHFSNLLTISSIFFGFCLTSLTFYIQGASSWTRSSTVDQLGKLAVELHIWLLMTWLGIIAFVLFLWIWGKPGTTIVAWDSFLYAFLTGLFAYGCLQIVSHVLGLSVLFHNRDVVQNSK